MNRNIIKLALASMVVMMASSCEKPAEKIDLSFASALEQPVADNESKNYLAMESYLYWEPTDAVRVYAGADPEDIRTVTVTPNEDDPKKGRVNLSYFTHTPNYYGIFPASCGVDGSPTTKINMPNTYTYRTDEHADFSFGTMGLPMVAWCDGRNANGTIDPPSLDFHSVCGIVRIQLYANSTRTVNSITFTECGSANGMATHPISGILSLYGIDKNAPYLSTSGSSGTKITINSINQQVAPSKLLTFYLPLPAGNGTTTYCLSMDVNTSAGTVTRKFKAKVRRNTLSFMQAINIDLNGDASIGMVGCGTKLRPFEIYSVADMVKVRTAYATPGGTINGITVGAETYFRVVRSDIQLTTANWTSGIANFKGYFTYSSGHATTVGIENTSNAPIFASIDAQGTVEGLYVRGTKNSTSGANFSPLCNINRGILNNCHSDCTINTSTTNLAGLCVTNYGTITNGANTGKLNANNSGSSYNYAAGLCLYNEAGGVIEGYNISVSSVRGRRAATICFNNKGTVRNSQVTLNDRKVNCTYGGLVYVNNGTISNSEILGALGTMRANDSVGGICVLNNGLIDGCRNGLLYLAGYGCVGGFTAVQDNSTAEIRNCFNSAASSANIIAMQGYAGGIVGNLYSGKVYNCYCNLEVQSLNTIWYGVIAGRLRSTADIQNCYNGSGLSQFYGEGAINGPRNNCFNPSTLDYCSTYNRSTGEITSIYNGRGTGATVGGQISTALNAWVAAHGSNYLSWTNNANPSFVTAK